MTMARGFVAAACALVLAGLHGASALECSAKFAGATFDLSDLKRATAYSVTGGDFDCTKEKEEEYRYFFNVCDNVEDKPSE